METQMSIADNKDEDILDELGYFGLEDNTVIRLKKENDALRASRDEWRKDAHELADFARSKGVTVRFSQS